MSVMEVDTQWSPLQHEMRHLDMTFCSIFLRIENESGLIEGYNELAFKIITEKGSVLSPSSVRREPALTSGLLAPTRATAGWITFETPGKSTAVGLVWEISSVQSVTLRLSALAPLPWDPEGSLPALRLVE